MEWLFGGLLSGSSLVQGGFYPMSFLTVGVLLAILLLFSKGTKPIRAELFLWGFAFCYILSSFVNGYDISSLAQAALPLCVALFLRCILSLSAERRRRLIDITKLFSGILSLLAILALAGVISVKGAVASGRLQFPFQYANAAGAWYGCMTVLSLGENTKRTAWTRSPVIAALILTQSAGAIGTYVLCVLIWSVLNSERSERWSGTVIAHGIAIGFALLIHFAHGFLVLPVLVLAVAVSCKADAVTVLATKIKLHWILPVLIVFGGFLVLRTDRAASAAGTFAERLIQMRDGASVAAAHLISGIGAGNWARMFPFFQSAQYSSAVVHSSIVQFAVDSGIVTAAIFAAFAFFGFKTPGRRLPETSAAGMLLFHSLFDFTFQFFPVFALFVLVLFAGAPVKAQESKRGKVIYRSATVLLAVLEIFLAGTKQLEKSIILDGGSKKWQEVQIRYEKYSPLLGKSAQPRLIYGNALLNMGKLEDVQKLYRREDILTLDELSLLANSLTFSEKTDEAYELLLDQLNKRIYDIELFEFTSDFLLGNGADITFLDKYNAIAERANNSVTSLGSMTGTQVEIKQINGKEAEQ